MDAVGPQRIEGEQHAVLIPNVAGEIYVPITGASPTFMTRR